jgi:serine/threonine protein kinase
MHSHYLAHCDLKSQNVLIEVFQGIPSCFLTDFGITQILPEQIVAARAFNIINLRGLSVYFAATEAFAAFREKMYIGIDFKKFDIYSFACVTYQILARKFPWI